MGRFYHGHFLHHKLTSRVGHTISVRSHGQTTMLPLVKYTPIYLEKIKDKIFNNYTVKPYPLLKSRQNIGNMHITN